MTIEQPPRAASAGTPAGGRRRYAAGRGGGKSRGKGGRRRGWRRFVSFKAFGLYALGLGLLGVIGIGVAYAITPVPEGNDFAQSETSIVYWSDGTTELGRFNAENRESVDIADVPLHVQHAVVAAEDRSFYENDGFDIAGIARAGLGYIKGGGTVAGGGSTITQQYVKNYYLVQDQTLARKFRELFISVKIDQQLDKDDILQSYLNTIWFGRSLYGVQTASRSYYGKPVSELTLEEGAGLAAILRSPHRYDPTLGPENAARFEERFRYVLDGMVAMGNLDEATAAAAVVPTVLPETKANRYGGPNGYLLQQVRRELISAGIPEAELDTGGLRIITTFDQKAQTAAVAAVEQERPTDGAENVHVGLTAIKPGDGGVVAMYGGPDAVSQPYDDALEAKPSAGSTVKPFTLAAALEEGISLESRYSGNSPFAAPELGPKPVNNQNDADYGEAVDLVTATERSINTAFVDLTQQMGPSKVDDMLIRSGFPEDTVDLSDIQGIRVTLGAAPVATVDMANSYATLASGGRRAQWYTVSSATAPGGTVLYEGKKEIEQVIDSEVVADVTYAMSQVVEGDNGSARNTAGRLGRPSAGKTGTHEDLSAWYGGFTPQLAAAVSIFRTDYAADEPTMMSLDGVGGMDTFTGGKFPAQIWTVFMKAALEGTEVVPLPERADVGEPVNPTPTATPSATPKKPTDPPKQPEKTETPKPPKPNEPPPEPDPTPTTEPDPDPTTEPPPDPTPSQTCTQGNGNGNGNCGWG